MIKKIILAFFVILYSTGAQAKTEEFYPYFKVNMQIELPDINHYMRILTDMKQVYNRGYESRYRMGKMFKKEFSRTIKYYGMSESRIKNRHEEDLIELLKMIPKSMYQYIGPAMHEVPGMSEKILNMPGIKETKNKFPTDIAERFQGDENLEYMSPALYFILMPGIWDKPKKDNLDKPLPRKVKKPKRFVTTEIPDFLKKMADIPLKTAEKKPASAKKKTSSFAEKMRTVSPTLTSPLTTKDVGAFVATLDEIYEFGYKNRMENYMKLIIGEVLVDMWEQEQGTALPQNSLKDIVNPCQRLVLKTRFAGVYEEFSSITIKQGFTPEEWAYTCDKTIKAFRVAEAGQSMAFAVKYHRRGYYDKYIDKMPERWRDNLYATQAAIIKMYSVFKEDVEAVKPHQAELYGKLLKNKGTILTAPIFY